MNLRFMAYLKNDKDKILIFVHIPKTGGTTLQGIINSMFFNRSFLYSISRETLPAFVALPHEKKYKLKAIELHLALKEFYPYITKNSVCITLLREPVDRVISLYYFLLSENSPYYKEKREKIISNNYSLKDFVQNGAFPNVENLQTRMLSGNLDVPHNSCTEEMLRTAKRNIDEQFELVGITEYFDEFLIMLMMKLGWRHPFYRKLNITHNRPQKKDIDKETLNIIEKHNQLDIALYQYAKEKFETRLQQMDGNFYKKLENFRKWNRALAPLINVALDIKWFLIK